VTKCPALSTTVVGHTTIRVSERNIAPLSSVWGAAFGPVGAVTFCYLAMSATATKRMRERIRLLRGGIIACSPECPERRQSPRLDNLHLHPPVLSVALLVPRRITQNILITKFNADLVGYVR